MNAYLEGINLAAAVVAMKRGQERMAEVHNIQTKLIQAEVNEEEVPYSLVMTHAQDHLANAISWSRMCQLLIDQMEREEAESYGKQLQKFSNVLEKLFAPLAAKLAGNLYCK